MAAGVLWLSLRADRPVAVDPQRSSDLPEVEQVYRLIRDQYYAPTTPSVLAEGAVRGMVGQLDEYSTYVPAAQLNRFGHLIQGRRFGVGLLLTESPCGGIVVLGSRVGSPAYRAGLRGGDLLLSVNGRSTGEDTPQQIEALLDHQDKSVLTLRRDQETLDVSLEPAVFETESVVGLCRDAAGRWQYRISSDAPWAYVRIGEFDSKTPKELEQVLQSLGMVRGLVLDLRDNPGGSLPEAVEVADRFLDRGVIVTSVGRDGICQTYSAHPAGTIDVPLVVLVNEHTASAAEMLAGALQWHRRAVLVGRRTVGKGCVQRMYSLPGDLGQINLTTAEFLIGGDWSISRQKDREDWGVTPFPAQQVSVSPSQEALRHEWRRRAEVLPFSVFCGDEPTSSPVDSLEFYFQEILACDPVLMKAAELLEQPETLRSLLEAQTQPTSWPTLNPATQNHE